MSAVNEHTNEIGRQKLPKVSAINKKTGNKADKSSSKSLPKTSKYRNQADKK